MEILLLLGLGAFLLSRTQTATQVITPEQQAAINSAAAAASDVLQIENSRIRLPHIIVNAVEQVWTNAEIPNNAFYKFVECKEPGGLNRILDIQNKFNQYETLKNNWIQRGRPRRPKFIRPLNMAALAYQTALNQHLQRCINFNKQL